MRHALLTALLAALFAGCLAAPAAAVPTAGTAATKMSAGSETAASLNQLINDARRSRGLPALRASSRLARAASAHARAMARGGFFSHESADGASPAARIRRYYPWSRVGETLLWRSPDVTPSQALSMWMSSPEHRRVLLGRFHDVGLAAIHATAAPGAFRGLDVTIVVADFGGR